MNFKKSVNGAVSKLKEWISNTYMVLLKFKTEEKIYMWEERVWGSTAIKVIFKIAPKRTEFSSEA